MIKTRGDNLKFITLMELKRLRIDKPDKTQIQTMKSILEYSGIITARLTFREELTEQEITCLIWIARGKTSQEIAKMLDLKYTTVRSYLSRIRRKLNCTTISQAVYEGIRFGYILPKFGKISKKCQLTRQAVSKGGLQS